MLSYGHLQGMKRGVAQRRKSDKYNIARSAAPRVGRCPCVPPTRRSTEAPRHRRGLYTTSPLRGSRTSTTSLTTLSAAQLRAITYSPCSPPLYLHLLLTTCKPYTSTLLSASESRSDDVVDNPRRPQGAWGKSDKKKGLSCDVVWTTLSASVHIPVKSLQMSIRRHRTLRGSEGGEVSLCTPDSPFR